MKVVQHNDGSYSRLWRCSCGRRFEVFCFDTEDLECTCGQWFNCFGQRLRDPYAHLDPEY